MSALPTSLKFGLHHWPAFSAPVTILNGGKYKAMTKHIRILEIDDFDIKQTINRILKKIESFLEIISTNATTNGQKRLRNQYEIRYMMIENLLEHFEALHESYKSRIYDSELEELKDTVSGNGEENACILTSLYK